MIKKETKVEWEWGNGTASGKVTDIHKQNISKVIDGNTIERNANQSKPAYTIKQEDGQVVLKSLSEIERK